MRRCSTDVILLALTLLILQGCDERVSSISSPNKPACVPDNGLRELTITGDTLGFPAVRFEPGWFGEFYLQLGDSMLINAALLDDWCRPVEVNLMSAWSSPAPAIATVRPLPPSGRQAIVSARGIGTADFTLLSPEGIPGWMEVHVLPRIATLTTAPATGTLNVGDSIFVTVTVTDTAGLVIEKHPLSYDFESGAVHVLSHEGDRGFWVFADSPGARLITMSLFGFTSTFSASVVVRSAN